MEQTKLSLVQPRGIWIWLKLYRLYVAAFPPAERKPFRIIFWNYCRGKNDLWCLYRDDRFAGFASMVNGCNRVLLDYFVVKQALRGQGIGSEALKALQEIYRDTGLFVEIESAYEPGDDQLLRQKRKQFYERAGMVPMKIMANVFGVKMELLGWNCEMTYDQYWNFYRAYLSPWAEEHVSEEIHPEA